MDKNKLNKIKKDIIQNKRLSKKIEIKIKEESEEIKKPRKRKSFLKRHLKTCIECLLLIIKTKIFKVVLYFITFIIFLFLIKILGLIDVYRVTSEFLIKALSYIGGLL